MSKELVIAANRHEIKVAILEDDQLVEVFFQRANEYSLAGSIHKGRVTRVLPGMQSAFVDLGLERDTFLYVSDFFEEGDELDQVAPERESRPGRDRDRDRDRRPPRVEAPPELAPSPVEGEMESDVEPVEAAAAEAVPETAGERAAAPPQQERPDRGDRGDRDHRRSRRRRNRGRGFPESKYASPTHTERSTPEPAASAPAPEPVETDTDFSILPGESLAKYRHAAVPMLDSGEQEEIEAASAAAEHTIEQTIPEELNGADADVEVEPPTPVVAEAPEPVVEPVETAPAIVTAPAQPEPEPEAAIVETPAEEPRI